MKRFCLYFCIFSYMLLFPNCSKNIDAIIDNIIKEHGELGEIDEIVFLDRKKNHCLIKLNYNKWQSTGYFINISNGTYYLLKNEPGYIVSLKFKYIDYLNEVDVSFVRYHIVKNKKLTFKYSVGVMNGLTPDLDKIDASKYFGEMEKGDEMILTINMRYSFDNNNIEIYEEDKKIRCYGEISGFEIFRENIFSGYF